MVLEFVLFAYFYPVFRIKIRGNGRKIRVPNTERRSNAKASEKTTGTEIGKIPESPGRAIGRSDRRDGTKRGRLADVRNDETVGGGTTCDETRQTIAPETSQKFRRPAIDHANGNIRKSRRPGTETSGFTGGERNQITEILYATVPNVPLYKPRFEIVGSDDLN